MAITCLLSSGLTGVDILCLNWLQEVGGMVGLAACSFVPDGNEPRMHPKEGIIHAQRAEPTSATAMT